MRVHENMTNLPKYNRLQRILSLVLDPLAGYPSYQSIPSIVGEKGYPLGNDAISHLGKRKIIFKIYVSGDMLVPRRISSDQIIATSHDLGPQKVAEAVKYYCKAYIHHSLTKHEFTPTTPDRWLKGDQAIRLVALDEKVATALS